MYGFLMVLVSLYCFGIPLGIFLMLKTEYQVLGYWIGYFVGALILISLQVTFILFVNWSKKAEKAFNQSVKSSEKDQDFNSSQEQNITLITPLLNKSNKKNFRKVFIKKIFSIIFILLFFSGLLFSRFFYFVDEEIENSVPFKG